jgi:sugar lactone lactonase YvrE
MPRRPNLRGWGLAALVAGILVTGGTPALALRASSTTPSAAAPPSPALASCPASVPIPSLPVFVRTAVGEIPDDLTVDGRGDVWVTVEAQGHIVDFTANGSVRQDMVDSNGPEGIIVVPEGTVVADQLESRVDRLGADLRLTPFLSLPHHPGRLPVDGLGFDPQTRRLLVPNSPNGTLLVTPLTVATPRQLAAGLGRPVAAAIGADGAIYVAAESRVGLWRVPRNGGAPKRVGTVSNLDEVVADGGLLYTTGAGDGTVRAVDPKTGADRVLATGGHMLQGLTALPDGRLLLIDSSTRTLSFVPPCP